jgi:Tfp pilus assembly protein PilZ
LAEDVSESGLALSSPALFGVGRRLLMDLAVAEVAEPIRLVGRVIWVAKEGRQARYRIGVEFDELSEAARMQLKDLVQGRAVRELAKRGAA